MHAAARNCAKLLNRLGTLTPRRRSPRVHPWCVYETFVKVRLPHPASDSQMLMVYLRLALRCGNSAWWFRIRPSRLFLDVPQKNSTVCFVLLSTCTCLPYFACPEAALHFQTGRHRRTIYCLERSRRNFLSTQRVPPFSSNPGAKRPGTGHATA